MPKRETKKPADLRASTRATRDTLDALGESVQQLDLYRRRHEEMLAMTFRRIADMQAQVDSILRQLRRGSHLGKKR